MSERLPVLVDPVRFADSGRRLEGVLDLTGMERLASMLARPPGDAQVELRFDVDGLGQRYVRGHIRTELWLTCQTHLHDLIAERVIEADGYTVG